MTIDRQNLIPALTLGAIALYLVAVGPWLRRRRGLRLAAIAVYLVALAWVAAWLLGR